MIDKLIGIDNCAERILAIKGGEIDMFDIAELGYTNALALANRFVRERGEVYTDNMPIYKNMRVIGVVEKYNKTVTPHIEWSHSQRSLVQSQFKECCKDIIHDYTNGNVERTEILREVMPTKVQINKFIRDMAKTLNYKAVAIK